jgi:DNA-binding NarL/FixJ family response regulator
MTAFTDREVLALDGVVDGLSVAEIAAGEGVTARAVDFWLSSARRKLGARNRYQAGALWAAMGSRARYGSRKLGKRKERTT